MILAPQSRLLFIGDSITDAGRNQPLAEGGLFDPLGKGYVGLVDALLMAVYPERLIRVLNVGTSGHTVRDLVARWDRDVLANKPDTLSICIGVNDVWRQFDSPRQPHLAVLPDEYERTLEDLVSRTRPSLKNLVLMTPFYIEPNRADPMRSRMVEYGQVVKGLAKKHSALLVDTQAAFDEALAHLYPATLAWDRVHPSQAGHVILARSFLKTVGFVF
jgi:lysophospholipase L1-like esterase